MTLTRKNLRLAGAAFALSAGLVACGNNNTTVTPINDGLYNVTVELVGVSGRQSITVTDSSGNASTYTMNSGGIVRLAPGTYTISAPTIGATTPAAQTITVTNAVQTVTFTY